jgi:hypothetical protein
MRSDSLQTALELLFMNQNLITLTSPSSVEQFYLFISICDDNLQSQRKCDQHVLPNNERAVNFVQRGLFAQFAD